MVREMMAHHYFLLIILLVVGSVLIVSHLQKWVKQEKFKSSNDVTAAVYSMIGVLLALILGFLIVDAYADYSTASSETQSEATQLFQTLRLAALFEEPHQSELQQAILAYIDSIHDQEWPAMKGLKKGHQATNARLTELWDLIRTVELKSDRDRAAYDKLIDHLGEAAEDRNERLKIVHENIPGPLWYLFVGVAVISILFLGLFGNTNLVLHRLMAGLVTLVLASCIILIHILDNPYSGPLKIEPDAFETAHFRQSVIKPGPKS